MSVSWNEWSIISHFSVTIYGIHVSDEILVADGAELFARNIIKPPFSLLQDDVVMDCCEVRGCHRQQKDQAMIIQKESKEDWYCSVLP